MWGSPSKGMRPVGQPGDRRDEAHHRAGEPAVDVGVADQRLRRDHASRRRRCLDRRCHARASAAAISRCRASAADGVRRSGPSAIAASTSARLVSDLLPGSETTPVDGGARARARARTQSPAHPTERLRSAGPWRDAPRGGRPWRAARASRRASAAARRARHARPGLALGVDTGEQQAAHHRDVLEEVDLLVALGWPGPSPPSSGARRAWSAPARRPARSRRGAARGRWPARRPAGSGRPALIRTSVAASVGIGGLGHGLLGQRDDLVGHRLGRRAAWPRRS